ncbi:MAG: hypothetical protein QM740_02210 [Acidovorax sp.]
MPHASPAPQPELKEIEPGVAIAPEDAAEIWAVLDQFMATFRLPLEDHIDAHLETYLFPHARIASGRIALAPDAQTYKERALTLAAMPPDWDHSEWVARKIVQAGKDKVHVVVTFNRYRKDHSLIKAEPSLHILEKVDGRWGIRARSSYAK